MPDIAREKDFFFFMPTDCYYAFGKKNSRNSVKQSLFGILKLRHDE